MQYVTPSTLAILAAFVLVAGLCGAEWVFGERSER